MLQLLPSEALKKSLIFKVTVRWKKTKFVSTAILYEVLQFIF